MGNGGSAGNTSGGKGGMGSGGSAGNASGGKGGMGSGGSGGSSGSAGTSGSGGTPDLEQACVDSGGTVEARECCMQTEDFPSTCLIGTCVCPPGNTHMVQYCLCPEDTCFDGTTCI
jgi:hypothetical protein